MHDTDQHRHQCPSCGEEWLCRDVACGEFCGPCQDEQVGEYFAQRFAQLPLPIVFNEATEEGL